MTKEIKVEMTEQVKMAVRVLMEKLSRQLPGVVIKSILIKDGDITVKE